MRRIFLLLFGVLAVFWWLGRAMRAARRQQAPRGSSPATPGVGGRMVRDRVCNTFLPVSEAIRLEDGSGELFFCSERCRDRFLAERSETTS